MEGEQERCEAMQSARSEQPPGGQQADLDEVDVEEQSSACRQDSEPPQELEGHQQAGRC
jgi:hypothetical protein